MESQSKKVVDDVLSRNLSVRNFVDNSGWFRNTILTQINEKNLIGEGGTGRIFLVDGIVVKEANVCYQKGRLENYCNDVKKLVNGEAMIVIPSGDNFRYILPNFLSEAVIGAIFKDINVSINLAQTLATYILLDQNHNPSVYFLMPRYIPISSHGQLNSIMTPLGVLYLLFQASTALLAAQETFLFTHYDLHIDNVLLDNWPSQTRFISYPVSNGNLVINRKLCPFIVKITDFGLSRLQLQDVLITPTVTDFPDETYGEFNSSYDIISLVGSILFDYRFSPPFRNLFLYSGLYSAVLKFILWLFDDTEIIVNDQNLNFTASTIAEKYYKKIDGKYTFRPLSVEGNFVNYKNTKSMRQVVDYLANLLLMNKMAELTPSQPNMSNVTYLSRDMIVMPMLANTTNFSKIKVFAPVIPNDMIPKYREGSMVKFRMDIIPEYVYAESYHIRLSALPNVFNFTIDKVQLKDCPIQEHYMTAVFVDPNVFGYEFTSECCKIDPINFLRMEDFPGFTINGGFFNIYEEDHFPIGNYKDRHLDFRNAKFPIPDEYLDVYGFICMTKNKLYITRDFDFAASQDYMFSSGPYLIENGEIVFDPFEERFACNVKSNVQAPISVLDETDKTITVSGYKTYGYVPENFENTYGTCGATIVNKTKTFPRCDRINPGELSHADNPNPRTAIVILRNGNYVFLTVEGRGNRGVGTDLHVLALMIKKFLPTAVTAINLDGGRSTNLAWRTITEPNTVYISNPHHAYQYPVGNILTFRKVK